MSSRSGPLAEPVLARPSLGAPVLTGPPFAEDPLAGPPLGGPLLAADTSAGTPLAEISLAKPPLAGLERPAWLALARSGIEVRGQALPAALPSEAGLPVPAERARRVEPVIGVGPDHARAQPLRHPENPAALLGPDPGRPAEVGVQVSDDAKNGKTVHALDGDDLKLSPPAEARYVRVLMTKAAGPLGYALSELEVWGHGGLEVRPKPAATGLALAGGAWKVQRDSLVKASGAELSQPGFADRDWIIATVPGTVLASYLNAGAVPDPDFGENQSMISDSFF